MRNKQRLSQAQAAQNARAIAEARTIAANQAFSPQHSRNQNAKGFPLHQQAEQTALEEVTSTQRILQSEEEYLFKNDHGNDKKALTQRYHAMSASSNIVPQQTNQATQEFEKIAPNQCSQATVHISQHERIRFQSLHIGLNSTGMQASSRLKSFTQTTSKNNQAGSKSSKTYRQMVSKDKHGSGLQGLNHVQQLSMGGPSSSGLHSSRLHKPGSMSKSPMTRRLRASNCPNRDLDLQGRSFSEAVVDDRNKWVASVSLNCGAADAVHLLEEETKVQTKQKTSGMSGLAQFPMGRQRVKSLQSTMPSFQSLGASKARKLLLFDQQDGAKTQKSRRDTREILNPTSMSLGSRSITAQSSGHTAAPSNAQKTAIATAIGGNPGETHIKLLVRIRPTLTSESATQCIYVQKGATGNKDTMAQILESQPLRRKAGFKQQSSSSLTQEAAATAAAKKIAPSIIKLVKGYNNISFKFDQVLPEGCSQDDSFQLSGLQIVKNFVTMGSSATIFAYGQTGAGKTYTIIGGGSQNSSRRKDRSGGTTSRKLKLSTSEKKGILPRVLDNLFLSAASKDKIVERAFIFSYYEIYNDKVYDLLKAPTTSPPNSNGSKEGNGSQTLRESLEVRERKDGNFMIHNLKKVVVNTRQEAYIWLEKGLQNRQICATNQNIASSRSHTIFQIESQSQFNNSCILRIVDLAGSEKYCYSNANQDSKMKELSSINQSLSTLGQCISALGDPQRRHIPFRNCKLTKILKDSLMQPSDSPTQTIVALIVCISPSVDSYQETQSTLQFADRAKKAILNQGPLQMSLTGGGANAAAQSSRLSQQMMDNMASEMEQLRKENDELKSSLQGIKQTNSQGSITNLAQTVAKTDVAYQQSNQGMATSNQISSASKDTHESIDLRLDLGKFPETKEQKPKSSHTARNPRPTNNTLIDDSVPEKSKRKTPRDEKVQARAQVTEGEDVPAAAAGQVTIRSCFRGARAMQDAQKQKKTSESRVLFNRKLDNDSSLDESIRERVEHNLKYNDDTIFDNLEIFQDIGETNNKVHGSKDKFNAKKLLSVPIDELCSDEDEAEQNDDTKRSQSQGSDEAPSQVKTEPSIDKENAAAQKNLLRNLDGMAVQPTQKNINAEALTTLPQSELQSQMPGKSGNQVRKSSGDLQDSVIDTNQSGNKTVGLATNESNNEERKNSSSNHTVGSAENQISTIERNQESLALLNNNSGQTCSNLNGSQMQSFSQSRIQGLNTQTMNNSFLPDIPSLNDIQKIQDTLNLSNDLSNDLIELGNDKQFNAFAKGVINSSHPAKQPSRPPGKQESGNILIQNDDDFFGDSKPEEDSLPLSNSLAFAPESEKVGIRTLSRKESQEVAHDMFKPQDKLFLNDMSNILQIEEQNTQRSIDPVNGNFSPSRGGTQDQNNQLQSTLILDAEEDTKPQEEQLPRRGKNQDVQSSPRMDDDFLNSSSVDVNVQKDQPRKHHRGDLQCNISENMISFDASRISPTIKGDLDTSQTNMLTSNILLVGSLQPWPPTRPSRQPDGQRDTTSFCDNDISQGGVGRQADLLDSREEQQHMLKPQGIERNFLQDLHTGGGSLFGRNHKKLAMPSCENRLSDDSRNQLDCQERESKLNNDEILTHSLTNTFSTIQSLGGELNALRNNLELNQKFSNKKKKVRGHPTNAAPPVHKVQGSNNVGVGVQGVTRLHTVKLADKLSQAPVSGAKGPSGTSQGGTQATGRDIPPKQEYTFSKRLQKRRSQERLHQQQAQKLVYASTTQPTVMSARPHHNTGHHNTGHHGSGHHVATGSKKLASPAQPTLLSGSLSAKRNQAGVASSQKQHQQTSKPLAQSKTNQALVAAKTLTAARQASDQSSELASRIKESNLSIPGQLQQQPLPVHTNIVPGDKIDQIKETYDEDDSSELMTDQSLSLDMTNFTKDLQTYYNKIHSEIAHLKHILLRTQHEQQQQAQLSSQQDFSQQNFPQKQGFEVNHPTQATGQTTVFQRVQNPRPHMSQSPQPHSSQPLDELSQKKINKAAIFRAQELIEQIKTEIMNGFSKSSQVEASKNPDNTNHPRGKPPSRSPSPQKESSPFSQRGQLLPPYDHHYSRQKPQSAMTFHPRQTISEPTVSFEIDQQVMLTTDRGCGGKEEVWRQNDEQMARNRNLSSQNVVSLLQRLQNELLESMPASERRQKLLTSSQNNFLGLSVDGAVGPDFQKRTTSQEKQQQHQIMGLSAKKLLQKRFELHPQFEEIEGSQERSPYIVRHMQVQKQNWIQLEESKSNATGHPNQKMGHQRQLFSSPLMTSGPPGVPSAAATMSNQSSFNEPMAAFEKSQPHKQTNRQLNGAASRKNQSPEDTNDVNVTSTSAAFLHDQSSHVIQRPLPVNRIQQKIAKDQLYSLDAKQNNNIGDLSRKDKAFQGHDRAPRQSPDKSDQLFKELYSPAKPTRSVSRGKNSGSNSKSVRNGGGITVQGPKILGIGSGSVAADHTLTLIFDSDEEIQDVSNSNIDQTQQQLVSQHNRANENKRLSEIVEDYLDEGGFTPTNHRERRDKSSSDQQLDDFTAGDIETSQPFQKALGVSREEDGSRPAMGVDDEQHSFMQESSLHNLFPTGYNNLGSSKAQFDERTHGRLAKVAPSIRQNLPQFDNCGGHRLSEITMPFVQTQKQDLSHISDDDLAFFLGSQGLNQNSVDQTSGQQDSMLQLFPHLDKKSSKVATVGPSKVSQNDNLFAIKEMDNAATEVEQTSAEPTQSRKQEIPAAQKWVPPPRIKNLRSKKNRKANAAQGKPTANFFSLEQQPQKPTGQISERTAVAATEEVKENDEGSSEAATSGPYIDQHKGVTQQRKFREFVTEDKKQEPDAGNSFPSESRHQQSKPSQTQESERQNLASGASMGKQKKIQAQQKHVSSDYTKGSAAQKKKGVRQHGSSDDSQQFKQPMMMSMSQAQNPKLAQHLMAPIHHTSMDMQDMSRYSENFDEEDYQEQSNNSSSKQSVQKYFFQFFNPSAKLHMQQQQFRPQTAFQQTSSTVPQATGTSMSQSSKSRQQADDSGLQASVTMHIPQGLASGIPRSSGKKSPLTLASRRVNGANQPHQQPFETSNINNKVQTKGKVLGFDTTAQN